MSKFPKVSLVLPFCIHIPEGNYNVRYDGQEYVVNNTFLPRSERPDGSVISGPNVEILHDVFGRAGSTKLSVIFLDRKTTENRFPFMMIKPFLYETVQVANRVLAVCRDQDAAPNGDPSFHLIPITERDLTMKEFMLVDENLNDIPKTQASMPLYLEGSLSVQKQYNVQQK